MKPRVLNYLLVLAITLLFIPSASATWSGFRSLGKTPVVGEPSCAQLASEEVMCVAQSQQHTLMANQFSKGAWSGWTNLSGTVTSDPSCVNDGTDTVVCGITSATNTLAAIMFNGKSWTSLNDSGGLIASGPSCALLRAGKVLCGARSVSGALTTSVFNGTTWGKFSTQAATLISRPGCASDDDGNVICAMAAIVNNATTVIVNLYDGLKWQGFLDLPGLNIDNPFCTAFGAKGSVEGKVGCFADSTNTGVYVNAFNGNGWSTGEWGGWGLLTGNVFPNRASCASPSAGSLVCTFVNVQDALLYTQIFNGTSWTGYTKVGGSPFIGGPSCTTLASEKVMCVVVGVNNQASSVTGP